MVPCIDYRYLALVETSPTAVMAVGPMPTGHTSLSHQPSAVVVIQRRPSRLASVASVRSETTVSFAACGVFEL